MKGSRRDLGIAAVVSVAFLAMAGFAWACVGVASLVTASPAVQPGGTLMVTGRSFAKGVPVDIRLDSPTGRLLLTVPGPDSTMNSTFTVPLTVPPEVASGRHLLVAVQNHHDMNVGAPARAVVYVGTAPSPVATAAARPSGVAASSGPSVAALILIGLGVAAAGVMAAAAWTLTSARGSSGTGAAKADGT
ncbi:MAG: hypothetical protein ACRDPR_03660 [Nocardioidaceae bacterium]